MQTQDKCPSDDSGNTPMLFLDYLKAKIQDENNSELSGFGAKYSANLKNS